MRKVVPIAAAALIFAWMALAGVFFLAENPGCLGPLVSLLPEGVQDPAFDPQLHRPLRIAAHIRASLASRTFQGLPFEVIRAVGASLWLTVVFLGVGLRVARAIRLGGMSAIERLAVATALGQGICGLAVLALGMAGLFHGGLFVAAMLAATLWSVPVLRRSLGESSRQRPRGGPRGAAEWLAIGLAAVVLAIGLIYALTPAIQSDGLRYHLAIPQVYLRERRIVYVPFNAFSNFPFLMEMLFTVGLAIGGEMAAKMIHFESFMLCGLLLACLSKYLSEACRPADAPVQSEAASDRPCRDGARRPRTSLIAPLVFWTTPTALIVGAWEFIDLGTAMFFTGAIYALVRWQESDDAREKAAWRTAVALFLGFLLGTKYTMLAMLAIVPLVLLVELPFFAPRRRWDFSYWFRSSALVVAVAAIVASPWFLKNVAFTGNPVYPLGWEIFDGGEWSAENARFYIEKSSQKGFHPRRDRGVGQTLLHMLVTPWEATVHWRQQPERGVRGYEDQFLGPIYLLWLPLLLRVLMNLKHRTAGEGPLRLAAMLTIAYGALWYFTYQSNRLLIPALAGLSLLVAYSLELVGRTARWIATGALAVLFLACLYNIEWSAEWVFRETRPRSPGMAAKPSPAAYLLGFQDRDEYLRQAFPPYAVYQVMPQYVGAGEKVLFVGEYRACYCPADWRASDWFDTPLILHYIRQTPDNEALLDRLLEQGVRWIFYNGAELAKYERAFFLPRFRPDERERFFDLFRRSRRGDGTFELATHRRLERVFSLWGMYLLRILPRSASTAEHLRETMAR